MKKNLTFLTGIVFLITILVAGSCSQEGNVIQPIGSNGIQPIGSNDIPPPTWEELDTVIIYLKAIKIGEEMHLEMYDSNHPDIVVDNLVTYVRDSTLVIWTLANDSGIKKLKKISPKHGPKKIITGNASGFFYTLFTKKKKLKIPDNQTLNDEEAYLIKFKDTDRNIWTIDPYLRVPPTP